MIAEEGPGDRNLSSRRTEEKGRSALRITLADGLDDYALPITREAWMVTDEDCGPLIEPKPVVKPDDPWID